MSTTSPRENAATDAQFSAAQYQSQLAGITFPEIQSLMGQISGNVAGGYNAEPSNIQSAFAPLYGQLNQQYNSATQASGGQIRQQALQSGQNIPGQAIGDATQLAALSLQKDQATATQQLKFQEAQAGMGQFNTLMSLLGGGAQQAMGLGNAGLGIQNSAASMLPGTSQLGGALGGAASGAAMGSTIMPGWGTAIGGVTGGLLGAFSGG